LELELFLQIERLVRDNRLIAVFTPTNVTLASMKLSQIAVIFDIIADGEIHIFARHIAPVKILLLLLQVHLMN
jgi:hypothetical protein